MAEELIPIVLFLVLGVIALGYFYWNHKNRQTVMETVQKAIETGGEFSPELLSQLGAAVNPRVRDLRRGIIFVGAGYCRPAVQPVLRRGHRASTASAPARCSRCCWAAASC